jgi:capsular exopolysaccharide synthesis family protein
VEHGSSLYKGQIAAPGTPRSEPESDWLQPTTAQPALGRFLQTVRERLLLVFIVFAVVVGAAVVYVATADKVYEADADILVTPVPTQEAVLSTVGVIVQSADPSLDVETANQLIDSPAVGERAAKTLDEGQSGEELRDSTSVAPIPESNIVAVTASGPSPEAAAERANAFAAAAVETRSETIAANIEQVLPQLREDLAESEDESSSQSISNTIATLIAFRASGNATIQVETEASPPGSAASPRTVPILVGAVIIGLALGIAAAFTAQVLDPRLRREEQLRGLFSLPILARITREKSRRGPLTRPNLTPVGQEGYRTLRAAVAAASREEGGPHSILIGGSGPSEGKSTTAINLATALAMAGKKVILIDADLRRPSIGSALELGERPGVVSVLLGEVPFDHALIQAPEIENLNLLVADRAGTDYADLFSLPAARRMLAEAERSADYVVIDSPPLGDVVDGLQLAHHVDEVLLVVHLGRTRIRKVRELAELLASSGIRPIGIALLGVSRPGRNYRGYAYGAREAREAGVPLKTT